MTSAGFPHSDIHGSSLASSSPWLFAGSRVLHRLLSPRHPSCALSTLTSRRLLPDPRVGKKVLCARRRIPTMVCGSSSEVPFVTSHSPTSTALVARSSALAARHVRLRFARRLQIYEVVRCPGTCPENWREVEAEYALAGLTYEIPNRSSRILLERR